jgi:hypothetical protein
LETVHTSLKLSAFKRTDHGAVTYDHIVIAAHCPNPDWLPPTLGRQLPIVVASNVVVGGIPSDDRENNIALRLGIEPTRAHVQDIDASRGEPITTGDEHSNYHEYDEYRFFHAV